ncbi:Alpha/beta hydrolase fold-1 [Bisporella sp. PMI_857]|nr:Alpha/beta hydrolase fold-1 [Bisporella sp. PMI_857]
MMSFPTMIFVHGAWHSEEYYDRVIGILEPLGYRCITVGMPSVGHSPPVKTLDDDIAAIRSVVIKELDNGKPVVVNAHSWGGIPVNNALDGLSKAEREKDGKSGVIKLTYVAAFVSPEGLSLADFAGGEADWWEVDNDGNIAPPREALQWLYGDLDPEDAKYWISKLRPHSKATFTEKARSAAWRKIPSAYLICENDGIIPVQGQETMSNLVQQGGGKIVIERVQSSHSAHLAKPDIVAEFLRRAAGENFESSRVV